MSLWQRGAALFGSARFDPSRRGFFRVAAGAAVAAVAAPLLPTKILDSAFSGSPLCEVADAYAAITRKAFVPQLFVQIYQSNLLAQMIENS